MFPTRTRRVRGRLIGSALLAALIAPTATLVAPIPAVAGLAPAAGEPVSAIAADDPAGGYGRMMLVLDSSGSMAEPTGGGATKIEAAKEALRTVVRTLPDEAEVGLRVFGAKVFSRTDAGSCEDTQQVVEPGTGNREALLDAIGDYEPYGETPIPNALREAAKDLGAQGARSIVLVSDGESTCAPDPCEVAAELADENINLQIDVVGLSVSGIARDQLQCVAEKGNGTYYDADNADDIESQLTRVAERAIRPFTLTGQPIEGGPQDNPTPVTVGDWIDRLGFEGTEAGSKSYSFERTTTGTALRVSAITQGQRGDDGLQVEIFDPAGDECDNSIEIRQLDSRELIGVEATAATESECAAAGTYRITVSRRLANESYAQFGLRVTEEPPVAESGFTATETQAQVSAPQVSGRPQVVTGGSSFANATALGDGRWRSTIVPGEALLFSFPLEFGQAARISVTYPEATGAAADTIGYFPPLAHISLYNPMQAGLGSPDDAKFSGPAGRENLNLLTATPAVSRDLVDFGSFGGVEDYSMAGDYYLGVSLMREDYSFEFPLKIDVEIVGEPAQGPTYTGGATWTVADGAVYSDSETTDEPSDPATSAEPTDPAPDAVPDAAPAAGGSDATDSGASTTVALVAGLGGLLAVVGAILLWRRRRA